MKAALILTLNVIFLLSCRNQPESSAPDNGGMGVRSGDMYVVEKDEDEEFIKEAGSGGMMEVELGKYAEQKAQNPRVRKFGSMMVEDHSNANAELSLIAKRKNIQVEMQEKHTRMMVGLQGKGGREFDREYMDAMVRDHREDLNKFRKKAEESRDPDVRAFASKNIPVLQLHVDSAKNIRDALK